MPGSKHLEPDRVVTSQSYRDFIFRIADQRIPLYASFEVTHRCNLSCQHCYLRNSHDDEKQELTLVEIEDLFDQLKEAGTLFLTLTGGEFFIREDALEIVAAARKRDFSITIFSNGTLITQAIAAELAALPVRDVHISFLGEEKIHDELTGMPGSFKQSLSAMRILRAEGVRTVAKLIMSRKAIDGLERLSHLAEQEADAYFVSLDIIPGIDGCPAPVDLQTRPVDMQHMRKPDADSKDSPARTVPAPDLRVCLAGATSLAIAPNGDLMPCVTFRRSAGNILSETVIDIWKKPEMAEPGSIRYAELAECKECELAAYCSYCPARGWREHNDPRRPAPDLCERAKLLKAIATGTA